jgi:hypothetical protein
MIDLEQLNNIIIKLNYEFYDYSNNEDIVPFSLRSWGYDSCIEFLSIRIWDTENFSYNTIEDVENWLRKEANKVLQPFKKFKFQLRKGK